MRYALTVIDNFFTEPDALRLRAQALEAEYQPFFGVDGQAEHPVKRVAVVDLPGLARRVSAALGRGGVTPPVLTAEWSGFRLDYAGELPNMPVHFDAECGDLAAVLYLNLPHQCTGGTAFWRHGSSALRHVPPDASPELEAQYRADGLDPDLWILESMTAMVFNRLVLYPTNYFHSRLPFEGFGSTPSDGRMIAGAFFSTGTNQ